MPGIAGIISTGQSDAIRAQRDIMVDALMHESTYRSYIVDVDGVSLYGGHVAHRGSFSDCTPLWNETRDICLLFSGEHLGDESEKGKLRILGHSFSQLGASHLLQSYEERGIEVLRDLNGMFSGVLADLRRGKVFVFNDRYGMNRLYWHQNEEGFYFASEAKCLLRVLPRTRSLDMRGLVEFVSAGCVLQNRSLFEGIELIPGGAAWTFERDGLLRKRTYFDAQLWERQPTLTPDEYVSRLKETWTRVLPRYFAGPEGVGVSLTGGVDSRLILAFAPRHVPCYTFGGPMRECADVSVARAVSQVCGNSHQTVSIAEDFFLQFPELVERSVYITDGTLDPTGAADLYVNRIARTIAPVRVTGLNGGEILRRLVMFKTWRPCAGLLADELSQQLGEVQATYAAERRGHPVSFIAFKQSPWHLYPRLAVERSQIGIRSPYFDNELVALAYQAPDECLTSEPALRLTADANPGLTQIGTDRAKVLRSILGVATLKHLLQEFTFKAEYAYDYGMPQWLARADGALRGLHLERLFLGRHKFYHYRLWYRDQFASYLRDVLLDSRARSRSYLNGSRLWDLVTDHTAGRANYTLELHRLLTLELVCRKLIDIA